MPPDTSHKAYVSRVTRTVAPHRARGGEKARNRRISFVRGGRRDEAADCAAKRSGPLTRAGEGGRRSVGPGAGGRRAQLVAAAPRKALAPLRHRADWTPADPAQSSLPRPRRRIAPTAAMIGRQPTVPCPAAPWRLARRALQPPSGGRTASCHQPQPIVSMPSGGRGPFRRRAGASSGRLLRGGVPLLESEREIAQQFVVLWVPKTRFCSTGDEVCREQDVM